MKRGRPPGSPVRDNVVEILGAMGELHGYDICRHYEKIFPHVSKRAIYYALQKGTKAGYFKARIEKHQDSYSWGEVAQRKYFSLGQNARPGGSASVKKYLEGLKHPQK